MSKNAHLSVKLTVALFGLLLLCAGHPASAQSDRLQCRWIAAEAADTSACDRRFSTSAQVWSSNASCTSDGKSIDDTVCCCPTVVTQTSSSPKLLLIGSVVGFFAIITILILALQKND